jgi:RNA polymerase sigma-B factor
MPATSHPHPEELGPSAGADCLTAPAPIPTAGDVGPVLMRRDESGSAPPFERPARSVPRPARDRGDNWLFERFAMTRDPLDRDAIVERFLPLARHLAASYHRPFEPFDDVFQSACYGLVKAVDRFELERGGAFTTYAVPTIVGEIKRHFRDRTWAVRVPRDLQELSLRVDRVAVELTRTLGRQPTVDEIADAIGVGADDVLEAMEAGHAYRANSIDAPWAGAEDGEDATIADTLGTPDDGFARAEERVLIGTLMRSLSARERYVLRLRFEGDLTQAEIGARIGVGQMQVSRILRRTVARLHRLAAGDEAVTEAAAGSHRRPV